jgi:hypothetical protein
MNSFPYCLNSLMSFLDKTEYNKATAFSQERLAAVTDIDAYRYLANKAYGTPEPGQKICQRSAAPLPLNTIRRGFLNTCLYSAWYGMDPKGGESYKEPGHQ